MAETPEPATVFPAIRGEELELERRPGAWAVRSLASLLVGLVALAAALPGIATMASPPADPGLRALHPFVDALLAYAPALAETSDRFLRSVVALCTALMMMLSVRWLRIARHELRRGRLVGPALYGCAVWIAGLWTLFASIAPALLEARGIPYDPLTPSVSMAAAIIMAAQSIAQGRLNRLRAGTTRAVDAAQEHNAVPAAVLTGFARGRMLAAIALVLAGASGALWLGTGSLPSLAHAIVALVAVLLAAAPIAFTLSGSVPFTSAMSMANEAGLEPRSAADLEMISRARQVVASLGSAVLGPGAKVSDSVMLGVEQSELLRVASALESGSSHPIATAILRRAEVLRSSLPEVRDFESRAGAGVTARLDGRPAAAGSLTFLETLGIPAGTVGDEIQQWESTGRIGIAVARDGAVIGAIGVVHEPLPGTEEAMTRFEALGIPCVLVSGSSDGRTRYFATRFGFERGVSVDAGGRRHVIEKAQRPVLAVGAGSDADWMSAADLRVVVDRSVAVHDAHAIVSSGAPMLSLSRGIDAARSAARAAGRAMFHATGHHLIAIPLASGAIFPLMGGSAPGWLAMSASPLLAAVFTAIATVAVTRDRVKR